MKKALVMFSLCLLANPIITAHAVSSTKKHRHHSRKIVQPAPVAASTTAADMATELKPAEETKPASWLDNFNGYATLTSNYIFRGTSQSRNLPAVQGSITYDLPHGFYANVWGSNVKFTTNAATIELDTIAGNKNSIGDNFSYDVNFARYNYPAVYRSNYNEINTVFNYYFVQAGISYSGNVYGSHAPGTYYNGGINYGIPSKYLFAVEDVSVLALFGHYRLPRIAGLSYNDYSVMLSKKIRQYNIALQWTSTNGRQHSSPYDGSQILGQVTANF